MASHTYDFYDLIESKLKDGSIENDAPKLFKNGVHLYPEEIKAYMSHSNPSVKFYAKALMVYNIISAPVAKPEFIDYIFQAESFAQQKHEHIKSFYFHLDQAASIIIRKLVEKLDPTSKRLAQLASKIKGIDSSFNHSYLAMQLKLLSILSELQLKLFSDINERIVNALLNNLDFFSNLGFDVQSLRLVCISPIITFIQFRNGIIPGDTKYDQNVEFDRKILVRIRNMLDAFKNKKENEEEKEEEEEKEKEKEEAKIDRKEIFDYYKNDIKQLLYKLEYQEPEDDSMPKSKFRTVKVKARRIPQYMEIKMISLDISKISNVTKPSTVSEDDTCKISISTAEYEKNNVIFKIYEAKNTGVYHSMYADAKIHQILSQNISDESCFLKYYGTIFDDTKVTLVMESFQENLSSRIKDYILKNQKFNLMK